MVPKGPIPSTTAPNESPRSPPPAPVCLCACAPLQLWFRVPPKVYFKGGCLETALGDLKGKERAFIVTGGWAVGWAGWLADPAACFRHAAINSLTCPHKQAHMPSSPAHFAVLGCRRAPVRPWIRRQGYQRSGQPSHPPPHLHPRGARPHPGLHRGGGRGDEGGWVGAWVGGPATTFVHSRLICSCTAGCLHPALELQRVLAVLAVPSRACTD